MPEPFQPSEAQISLGTAASMSVHKLSRDARRGLGELHALQHLFDTEEEDYSRPTPRHVISVADVTRGLGLDREVETLVQRMIDSTRTDFNRRTGSQRLIGARGLLLSWLRGRKDEINATARLEIVRRADAYWRKRGADDMRHVTKSLRGKKDAVLKADHRFTIGGLRKSGGQQAGHKYVKRSPDGKGGWTYEYAPDAAAADRVKHAQAAHDAARDALFSAAKEGKTTARHGTDFAESAQALADAQAGKPDREGASRLVDASEEANVASDQAHAGKRSHSSAAAAHWKVAEKYRLLGHHGYISHESQAEDHERMAGIFAAREEASAKGMEKLKERAKEERKAARAPKEKKPAQSPEEKKKQTADKAASKHMNKLASEALQRMKSHSGESLNTRRISLETAGSSFKAENAKHLARFGTEVEGADHYRALVAQFEKDDAADKAEHAASLGGPRLPKEKLTELANSPEAKPLHNAVRKKFLERTASGMHSADAERLLNREFSVGLHQMHYASAKKSALYIPLVRKSMGRTLAVPTKLRPMLLEW